MTPEGAERCGGGWKGGGEERSIFPLSKGIERGRREDGGRVPAIADTEINQTISIGLLKMNTGVEFFMVTKVFGM